MSLQARRIGETQAQYNRRVGTKRPRTVFRPQKVERVSVTPQQIAEPMTAEEKRKRKPQQTGVGVTIPEKKTDRGRPVTRIGNRTIYEADMREAKANQQNLLEAQRRNAVADKRVLQAAPDTRTKQERDAELQRFLKNAPPEIRAKIMEQLKKQKEILAQRAKEKRQVRQLTVLEPFKDTPELRRKRKEFERKNRIAERYMRGEIGRRELKRNFNKQEIRNIERGSFYRKYMDGKITDRQLGRSGMFSLREIRDIKRQLRLKRMSPEERRVYFERQRKERQRLDKMAEDRRTQPQRRRRQVRRAYRRVRGGDRDNVITYQTTGRRRRVSPTQTQRRRVAPTQRRRRGMRVPI